MPIDLIDPARTLGFEPKPSYPKIERPAIVYVPNKVRNKYRRDVNYQDVITTAFADGEEFRIRT